MPYNLHKILSNNSWCSIRSIITEHQNISPLKSVIMNELIDFLKIRYDFFFIIGFNSERHSTLCSSHLQNESKYICYTYTTVSLARLWAVVKGQVQGQELFRLRFTLFGCCPLTSTRHSIRLRHRRGSQYAPSRLPMKRKLFTCRYTIS